ncbi:unnamed protein product, partial [marine sediment metagenome]
MESAFAPAPKSDINCFLLVSIDNLVDPDYSYAANFTKRVARQIIKNGGLPKGTLLNINIPDVCEKEI